MESDITMAMYAAAIGTLILKYVQALSPELLSQAAESEAMKLISEIQAVLDDESLDDPACFRRIDGIVDAFFDRGLPTGRHDW